MEKVYFNSVKEKHETFFIEYHPPIHNFPFATLHINYHKHADTKEVIIQLEIHAIKWAKKYPIPVMASAFDEYGDLISFGSDKESSHLTVIEHNGQYENHWNLLKDDEFPVEVLDTTFLLSVYSDIDYRTQSEVTKDAYERIKPMRHLKFLLLIWAVFVPVLIAILEFFSPIWIAVIALSYSLWKANNQWLLIIGRKKKSEKDIVQEEENLKMRHHHYHCEQNSDAFTRMKIENFKRESKERVKNKFESLPESN
jgi:hypothetical protein